MSRYFGLLAVALLASTACQKTADADTPVAAEGVKKDNLAAAIDADSRFGKALAAAGMAQTFAGPAVYTLLVPSDAAFDKLPAGALDALMKPEGKAELTRLLGTHVLSGTIMAADLAKAIEQGGGTASLPTLSGETLTARKDGDAIVIADAAGGKAVVTASDEGHENGVIHRLDSVLMPKA